MTLSDEGVVRLRDLLVHRGPDGAGLWRGRSGQVVLAHRRLAVIDPSAAGSQPMLLDDPTLGEHGRERWALVYNGELYNDRELRGELERSGARFSSSCDTETLLWALATWGSKCLPKLRGMFAFALVDQVAQTVMLARDPMGIKPLYYRQGGSELVFASELGPIVEYDRAGPRPDLVVVSSYLTTIRTTLQDRTLFEGVRCVRPGELVEVGFGVSMEVRRECDTRARSGTTGRSMSSLLPPPSGRGGNDTPARRVIEDSVVRHLRSDVATCSLLSGGLDSSIIVAVARSYANGAVRTYCSGHDDASGTSDLAFAREAAEHFGTVHTSAGVTREMFRERWPEMVRRMGVPLSTPNEVAINEVARRLREDRQVVALSGEGADELFAGYELPMRLATEFEEGRRRQVGGASSQTGGEFQLRSNAWALPEAKAAVFRPEVWQGLENDVALFAAYEEQFAACEEVAEGVPAHLMFHRRVNLTGLLQRLDTATMLEGVEGRTPFADAHVCAFAESLPLSEKYERSDGGARTKIALREAFADELPTSIVNRPKASFPLPFQDWLVDSSHVLRSSEWMRTLFSEAAITQVADNPQQLWNFAWPMINLAMWGERWWEGSARRRGVQ